MYKYESSNLLKKTNGIHITICIFITVLLFIIAPILKYESLHSTYFDLGVYAHNMFKYDAYKELWSGHINFFFPIVAYLYKALPENISTQYLLLIQSFGLLLSVKLVFQIYGKTIGFIYLYSYLLWFNNLFDFHFEFISIYFFLKALQYNREDNYKKALLFATLLALTKEIYALTSIFISLYIMTQTKNKVEKIKKVSTIILFIITMFIYFTWCFNEIYKTEDVVKIVEINSLSYQTSNLISSISQRLNEFNVIYENIFIIKNWYFILLPILNFYLVPMLGYRALIMAIPTMCIAMLSINGLHNKFNSHYFLILLPIMCESFYLGQIKLKNKYIINWIDFEKVIVYTRLVIIPLASAYLLTAGYWSYEIKAWYASERDVKIKEYILTTFENKNLMIDIQNNINYYPIYNRNSIRPIKIYNDENKMIADFVVYDLKRPLFLEDKSCNWRSLKCNDNNFENEFKTNITNLKNNYKIEVSYDDFFILKKSN
jgi:uncharacterized membrane protein